MARVEVTVNPEFTALYKGPGHEHHARITVEAADGSTVVGASGGGSDDLSNPKTDAQIEAKFRTYAKARLPAANVDAVINAVNRLEEFPSARELMQLLRAGRPA
mgnify:CR=1 FL=1